ncbi:unnamed protein product [Arctia plantaginis]|uniref:Uncharacterized protein n=1 Tax=Arctia plantaginis TaxID=874455 RepID=A0A8S1ANN5_ARCPL|nr:unnamed protein product [Arctia plantaginis]
MFLSLGDVRHTRTPPPRGWPTNAGGGETHPVHPRPHSGRHEAVVGGPPPPGSPAADRVRVEVALPGPLRRLLPRDYYLAEGCDRGKTTVATGHGAYYGR